MSQLVALYDALADKVDALEFGAPVSCVYNPLRYARTSHLRYMTQYGEGAKGRILFLGMNPGPWGMTQTGVPFGEIDAVKRWMGLESAVTKPAQEHSKRPIEGFACKRSEVSGKRLWGFFEATFGTASAFFEKAFVANYCPLVFMEASGANRTPDKLPKAEREPLLAACDATLAGLIQHLEPSWVIGVGDFARKRAEEVVKGLTQYKPQIGQILHPSPASPRANRGWAQAAREDLAGLGIHW